MKEEYRISEAYAHLEKEILSIPERFDKEGELVYSGRNILKVMNIGGIRMCIKSFKLPHIINKVAYAYVRPSKAERSYDYAMRMAEMGVGTPQPVGYILFKGAVGLTHSYYISLQLDEAITFREIVKLPAEEQDDVYRAFARFTYHFHQKGIYFIDHSPGNTMLRKEADGAYHFYLVDLNRMKFETVSPLKGLKNLSMLEVPEDKLRVIAKEYAILSHSNIENMEQQLIRYSTAHNKYVERKSCIRDCRRYIKRLLSPQGGQ
ncbi:lipopolysaccharide kinase InaA family protein [Parabacteroides bouchesdurhonensis]|uniref:lipopolysaccharide kinase InaA family protein n=1 Tax=Parabacteroides bouchesdurhonensis TaxID=1936995 RepID=UPI000E496736|nr:lipopolysaccharide kinase InaA family protein [Parabacteroides bouchesdurhonensis]RHJ94126.1 Kdo domain containing protein [Bacteroides sp. AM07-16]